MSDGTANTIVVGETVEESYSAWFDGATAAVVALHTEDDNSTAVSYQLDTSGKYYIVSTSSYDPTNPTAATTHATTNIVTKFADKPTLLYSTEREHGPSSAHPEVIVHLFGDGSVHAVHERINPNLYFHLTTKSGGEPVGTFFSDEYPRE